MTTGHVVKAPPSLSVSLSSWPRTAGSHARWRLRAADVCRGHSRHPPASARARVRVRTSRMRARPAVLGAHALALVEHGLPGIVVTHGMLHAKDHRPRPLMDTGRRPPHVASLGVLFCRCQE